MMKVVETFKPYKVPLQTLLLSNENLPFLITNPSSVSSHSNSEDDTSSSSKLEHPLPFFTHVPLTKKKRGRKYKNLKECFKCPIEDCKALFQKQNEINEHMNTMHQVVYTCSYEGCELKYTKEDNLNKHFKTHNPTRKKYECPYPGCGKKFTASYNQKIHYRYHTGERPYKCDKCGCDYYDRANYKYHMRTAHLDMDAKDKVCSHNGCEHTFKTKKQKLMHHDKLDEECRMEKYALLRLLVCFKKGIEELVGKDKVNKMECKDYTELLKQKIITQHAVADQGQFNAIFLEKGEE